MSGPFEEAFSGCLPGDVVQATGRFSKISTMSDNCTSLTYFEPIYMQDISPYRVSRPCGWKGFGNDLDGFTRATAARPDIECVDNLC